MAEWEADPVEQASTCTTGDRWAILITLQSKGDDGTYAGVDLSTLSEKVAEVKTEPGRALIASPVVTVTSAVDGELEAAMAPEVTAALAPGTYRYGVRVSWPSGCTRTLVGGRLTVQRGVVAP